MSTNETLLRCWVEIDRSALRHNLAAIREALTPGTAVAAVLKANAYGHGLESVAQALAGEVEAFAVANVAEALALRAVVPQARVLLLGPVLPHERPEVVTHRLIPSLSSSEEAEAFAALLVPGAEPLEVHLAVDTGMGRIGVWKSGALSVAQEIAAMPQLFLGGIGTHLPVADDDPEWSEQQLGRWRELIARLKEEGVEPPTIHALNSAGVIRFGRQEGALSNGNLARTGLMLYGSSPIPEFQHHLRPVLTWKSRVTLVRDVPQGRPISYGRTFITPSPMRLATIGVGYGDGYLRYLSGSGAQVLIGGERCPVLGRVTMDQIVVDISKVSHIRPGDEVVLLGRQGEEEILAAELAQQAGTIAWELFTGLTARVVRCVI